MTKIKTNSIKIKINKATVKAKQTHRIKMINQHQFVLILLHYVDSYLC
jgi:hypothetical protein